MPHAEDERARGRMRIIGHNPPENQVRTRLRTVYIHRHLIAAETRGPPVHAPAAGGEDAHAVPHQFNRLIKDEAYVRWSLVHDEAGRAEGIIRPEARHRQGRAESRRVSGHEDGMRHSDGRMGHQPDQRRRRDGQETA